MKTTPRSTLPAIAAAALAMICFGAPASADNDLGEVTFGDHLSGPKIKKSDLKGHVVAIEIWGTR